MVKFEKLKTSIEEQRDRENLEATVQEQAAIIDYIAAMTDTELPGKGDGEEMRHE